MLNIITPFKLFSCCFITTGATRSLIADVQRGNHYFIPNEISDILIKQEGTTIESVLLIQSHIDSDILLEYFEYLYKNEIIFFTNNPDNFPPISGEFSEPKQLSNAIIDYDLRYYQSFDWKIVFEELADLGCRYVEIRCYSRIETNFLEEILGELSGLNIHGVDLLLLQDKTTTEEYISNLYNKFGRIHNITIHGADEERTINVNTRKIGTISFLKKTIQDEMCCGEINPQNFIINTRFHIESINFNTCLNRKISIDKQGMIKKCPAFTHNFGDIRKTSLREAVKEKTFKSLDNISKNQIETCSVCEFRNICMDCRALRQNTNNLYSKPIKCSYDPYTNSW